MEERKRKWRRETRAESSLMYNMWSRGIHYYVHQCVPALEVRDFKHCPNESLA